MHLIEVVGPVLVEMVLIDLLGRGLDVSVQDLTLGIEPTHWSTFDIREETVPVGYLGLLFPVGKHAYFFGKESLGKVPAMSGKNYSTTSAENSFDTSFTLSRVQSMFRARFA